MTEYQLALEALNNGNESPLTSYLYKTKKVVENRGFTSVDIDDEMRLEILIICVKNQLKNIYNIVINNSIKRKIYDEFKDSQSCDILFFLFSNNLFKYVLLEDIVKFSDNKVLHQIVKRDVKYFSVVNEQMEELFDSKDYERISFFVNNGCNFSLRNLEHCYNLISKINVRKANKLFELGLFKNSMNHMLFNSILLMRDDLIKFFFEKGSKIMDKMFIDKIIQFSIGNRHKELENLLKYSINLNTKINDQDVFDRMKDVSDDRDYSKVSNLLLKHSSNEMLSSNFTKLIKFLSSNDITENYNRGAKLDVTLLKTKSDFAFTKDKIVLLLELDENFLEENQENLDKFRGTEVKRYIETVL